MRVNGARQDYREGFEPRRGLEANNSANKMELAVPDALFSKDRLPRAGHSIRRPAKDGGFYAHVMAQVSMHGRQREIVMVVLHIDQTRRDVTVIVVSVMLVMLFIKVTARCQAMCAGSERHPLFAGGEPNLTYAISPQHKCEINSFRVGRNQSQQKPLEPVRSASSWQISQQQHRLLWL